MKRNAVSAIVACALGLGAAVAHGQPAAPALTPGQVEPLLALPTGNSPEGVAIDSRGRVYVSCRVFGASEVENQVLRVFADGRSEVFATLPPTSPDAQHILGLATDSQGNVYAALASFDPATSGVYRIDRHRRAVERLPGSEGIAFPNALAFDAQGNLYATDSLGGAVWRYGRRHRVFQPWAQDALLEPILDQDPFGGPLPGANGIAFRWPDQLFVANTEKSLIARIQIRRDGSAGPVASVTNVPVPDGIAVDIRGDIHAALPGFLLVGAAPLVRVDPDSGSVTPTVAPDEYSYFDVPLSIAFGVGRNRRTLYVTNGALQIGAPPGPGPGVVRAGTDVSGAPR